MPIPGNITICVSRRPTTWLISVRALLCSYVHCVLILSLFSFHLLRILLSKTIVRFPLLLCLYGSHYARLYT